jgi:3-oxoacyl-[acyl-carrier protein] reductase
VVVADLDSAGVTAVAEELTAAGGSAEGLALDVVNRAAVEAAIARIERERGGLGVLVNLAGIIRNAVLAKIDDGDFADVLAVHVQGTLNTMRAAVPLMRRAG